MAKLLKTRPGKEHEMEPKPISSDENFKPAGKLQDKVAIITGGDSGIGKAVAIAFAKEGAHIVIAFLDEHKDAEETKQLVENESRNCLLIPGDIGKKSFCEEVVLKTIEEFGKIDTLVNNAAEQHPRKNIEEITEEQLLRTFQTNIFSFFYLTQVAMPHLKPGSTIINTTSVTAYRGSPQLLDYSTTKGAIVAFTRSLALNLVDKGIRVNGVAPGPIWTPLIPSTFPGEKVDTFGKDTPMKRAGQPEELAPAYVYLASDDSSYMTGQILHLNGGEIING